MVAEEVCVKADDLPAFVNPARDGAVGTWESEGGELPVVVDEAKPMRAGVVGADDLPLVVNARCIRNDTAGNEDGGVPPAGVKEEPDNKFRRGGSATLTPAFDFASASEHHGTTSSWRPCANR